MILSLSCPACQAPLKFKGQAPAGAVARCPRCKGIVPLPAPPPADATAASAAPAGDATATYRRGDGTTTFQPGQATATFAPPAAADHRDVLAPPEGPGEIGRLGPYRVTGRLGAGGMGLVFRAEDPQLKRQVALKVMLPRLAADPAAKARFLREARAQAQVEHDHVIAVYQVGEDRGVPFLAMPLLKGQTLAEALRQSPRPPLAEVVRVGREAAEGLAAAHDVGLVHRDVKPSNVWLEGSRRRVKILDFGLARVADADPEAAVVAPTADADSALTLQGAIVGTPLYMSPEQARGEPVDPRTDVYSLGVVLYQMATGRLPFRGPTTADILAAVVSDTPAAPAELNPAVPPALSDLVVRMLAKAPGDRPPTAAAVAAELDRIALVGSAEAGPPAEGDPWQELGSDEGSAADAPAPARGRRGGAPAAAWLTAAAVGAVAVGLAVGAYLLRRPPAADPTPHTPTVGVTPAGPPAPDPKPRPAEPRPTDPQPTDTPPTPVAPSPPAEAPPPRLVARAAPAVAPLPPDRPARAALPDKAPLAEAIQKVRTQYAAEYARKGRPARADLAAVLEEAGELTRDDPARRFALWAEARDQYAQGLKPRAALRVCDRTAAAFDVDGWDLKAQTLGAVLKLLEKPPADLKDEVVPAYLEVAAAAREAGQAAADADEFAHALALLGHALTAATRARHAGLIKELQDEIADLKSLQAALAKVAAGQGDPGTNLVVGKRMCVKYGRWADGCKLLVQTTDVKWKAAARAELAGAATPDARLALGDLWWAVGDAEGGVNRAAARRRAAHWYDLGVDDYAGADAEKRRAEALKRIRTARAAPDLSATPPARLYDFANGRPAKGPDALVDPMRQFERGYAMGRFFYTTPQGKWWTRFGRSNVRGFAVEVRARVASPTGMWVIDPIGTRRPNAADSSHGLNVTINHAGELRVGGHGTTPVPVPERVVRDRAIRGMNQTNVVLLLFQNARLDVYVNGEQVIDPVPVWEPVGDEVMNVLVGVWARDGAARVEYERIVVWEFAPGKK